MIAVLQGDDLVIISSIDLPNHADKLDVAAHTYEDMHQWTTNVGVIQSAKVGESTYETEVTLTSAIGVNFIHAIAKTGQIVDVKNISSISGATILKWKFGK